MKAWWFEWGDIDNYHEFYYDTAENAHKILGIYGPYDTFTEAKKELLERFRSARDELNGCIDDVKKTCARDFKGFYDP